MTLKKSDFIEIEFTGKVKDGEVFDSNIKSELEKLNPQAQAKPFIFPLGQGMFLKGIDDFLIGKDVGKHQIELEPEKAFGKREPKLIRLIPRKIFIQHKINPVQGAMFNIDGRVAKIISASGGRILVDFNNPLAGKTVQYKINIKKKIVDKNKKIKALNEFLFKKDFKSEIKQKKLILYVPKEMTKFVEMFKDKYKEILGLELEVKDIEPKKPTKAKVSEKSEPKDTKKSQ